MTDVTRSKQFAGRIAAAVIIASALIVGAYVLWLNNINPRTDDANVVANYIGIAPEVDGRIIALPIRDNQLMHKGDLLYKIDPQPYEYKLQQAISARDSLEQQIIDERRKIGAQNFAVRIANRGTVASAEMTSGQQAAADASKAQITTQEAIVSAADAQSRLAENNLERAEPLLAQHFVTVQQIDQLRTAARSSSEDLARAKNTLAEAEAKHQQAEAQLRQSVAAHEQQTLRVGQSTLEIDRLDTLLSQKLAREAAVKSAAYDLQRCQVYAPFDARVTNLNISVGQYARTGTQVFALIDTTAWWALGNFKETQLHHIAPGMPADVYLMTRPDIHFRAVVESIGFGVNPADISPGQSGGLPTVTRTLNWVRLAQRFPVRVRVLDPRPELYRLGASATVIVRGDNGLISVPPNPNTTNIATYSSLDGHDQPSDH